MGCFQVYDTDFSEVSPVHRFTAKHGIWLLTVSFFFFCVDRGGEVDDVFGFSGVQ